MPTISRRDIILSAPVAAAAFGLDKSLAIAAPPRSQKTPDPAKGFFRYKVGDAKCTAVCDGIWEKPHDPAYFSNATLAETKQALVRAGLSTAFVAIPITVFVVELALGALWNTASFYKERGFASYRSGNFAQAIANFNVIRLDPGDAHTYNIRANAWDEMGSFKRALADYDQAIRIDPNNPAIFLDRAILWQRRGELDKALIDLDRAIRFSFSDVHMYCDPGLVWCEKGRHDRALTDFNHAIKLDSDVAAACIKRGLIVHRISEIKPALATRNEAIRVDPSIFDALRQANSRP